ncbi:DUF397 domain-containing protein [Actinophytocola sediminis]
MENHPVWRKSSRSQNGANCVELCDTLDLVRDSKNVAGSALRGNVPDLLNAIRAGRFDRW